MSTSEQSSRATPEPQISQSLSDLKPKSSTIVLPNGSTSSTTTPQSPKESTLSPNILPSTSKPQTESILSRQASQPPSVLSPLQSKTESVTSPPPSTPTESPRQLSPSSSTTSQPQSSTIYRRYPPPSSTASIVSDPSFQRLESKTAASVVSSQVSFTKPSERAESQSSSITTKSYKTSTKSSTPSSKKSSSMTSSFEAQKSSNNSTTNSPHTLLSGLSKQVGLPGLKSSNNQARRASRSTTASSSESKSTTPAPIQKTKTQENQVKDTGVFKFSSLFDSGKTSYLGRGTMSQLEDCLRSCLDDNSHSKYELLLNSGRSRGKSLNRASVLEDYSYDGIICGKSARRLVVLDDCPSICDRKLSAKDLSLKEIREVNEALAKQGISVFSPDNHHHHHHNHHNHHHQNHHHQNHHHQNHHENYHPNHHHDQKPHSVGELLSACRLLMDDPTLASYHRNAQSMRSAWDHIHNYPGGIDHPNPMPQFGRPGSPNPSVYSTPSYMPNSTSTFMPGPPQPPPPMHPPIGGGPSYPPIGGGPSYPPMINANSYMPGPPSQPPPPPQPSQPPSAGSPNAGRNVLASLFSGRPM